MREHSTPILVFSPATQRSRAIKNSHKKEKEFSRGLKRPMILNFSPAYHNKILPYSSRNSNGLGVRVFA